MSDIRELNLTELEHVEGGWAPLAIAVGRLLGSRFGPAAAEYGPRVAHTLCRLIGLC